MSFESTPSLPEDEILSRLLFGSGVSDLSPLQASQLAAQLSGAGWLDAMAGVRSALGIDRLDVRAERRWRRERIGRTAIDRRCLSGARDRRGAGAGGRPYRMASVPVIRPGVRGQW
ncbi:MAG: translocation/assembly module TamB domain-containing protein [Oceanicaulis sp.]|nr:translocation/assembly module TamB domain-containing protein [Oceanicaulis sp.]